MMPSPLREPLAIAALMICCGVGLACHRGPDTETLRVDLLQRLDQSFEEGLFRIAHLQRMGSALYRASGQDGDVSRLLIYYDAELVLERPYTLTAWKGLNLGTLAFVLGATESGIQGFKPRGNAAGDILRIHGRIPYHGESGSWRRLDDGPPPKKVEPAQKLRGSGPDAVLEGVRQLLARSPDAEHGTRDAVIVGELRRAVSRINLQVAPLEGQLTFGAGPALGTYSAFGAALSDFASREGLPLYSYASDGSVENGKRLQGGTLDFGLMQSDVAERLYQGWAEEGIFPNRDLRSVASLWPEAVHLVTLEGSGIRGLGDLRQRRVAIGRLGSGTRFNAVQIGLAAGLGADNVPDFSEVGLVEGLADLAAGRVDALFVTEAIPSPALQAFAAGRSDVRFVSLDPELVMRLSEEDFAYYPLTVEARTYPGQDAPLRTLGIACSLMTSRHVADESVGRLLALLVDGVDELSRGYFRAAFISPETMRLGMAVPLHPAAERFYTERKARASEDGGRSSDDEANEEAAEGGVGAEAKATVTEDGATPRIGALGPEHSER